MTKRLHFTSHFHALEKEMATHSSVLAWRIPGTEKPGGLLSMGSHRVGHDWSDLAAAAVMKTWACFFLPLWVWKMWIILYVNCEDYRSKVCIEYLHYNEPLWMVAILITMKKILIIIKFLFCCWISHKFRDMVDWSLEINIHKHNDMHLIDVLVS